VAEVDRLKEQVAYLRFWLLVMIAMVLSLAGYLAVADTAPPGDAVVSIIMLAVVLVFVGIALHAAREK
jgi:hypothetical protein